MNLFEIEIGRKYKCDRRLTESEGRGVCRLRIMYLARFSFQHAGG